MSNSILNNVTISNNTNGGAGAGIYSFYSFFVLYDVLIFNNSTYGGSGGGINLMYYRKP